jgi:hypothetical protein
MKQSDVYRKAARLIERRWQPVERDGRPTQKFSCWAIVRALGKRRYQFGPHDPKHPFVQDYESLFRPEGEEWCWGKDWYDSRDPNFQDNCRVLALCFMAAIVD